MGGEAKSASALKKQYPTMYETLEALRNPPAHLLEENFFVKKVSHLVNFDPLLFFYIFPLLLGE